MDLNLSYGALADIWDSENKIAKMSGVKRPDISDGNIYIGYDTTDGRAMMFADFGGVRYPFAAKVKWSDITSIPDLATQAELDAAMTTVDDTYLKLSGGTMAGEITIGQGDGSGIQLGTNGRINATITKNGVTSTTCTIVGLVTAGTATFGHGDFDMALRGKQNRPTYNSNNLALYSDIPTDFTTTTAATNALKDAKDYTDDEIDAIDTKVSTLATNSNKTYFSTLGNGTNTNSFKLTTPTAVADGGSSSEWTANNYYPTGITWNESWVQGSTSIGTIAMCNNGTSNSTLNISIPPIPAATATTHGVVSTSNQSFAGIKNFATAITLTDKIKLEYKSSTESLDFSFL